MMKKTKNKRIIILLSFGFATILLIALFYCYIAFGFANAVVKTVKAVDDLEKNWDSLNVNPIDSVNEKLIFMIDSTASKN